MLKTFYLCLLVLLASGCIRYHSKPISPDQSLADFEARSLAAPELVQFLQRRSAGIKWPPSVWDLHALTLVAIYYHPDLDVARAQWGVAQASRITAGERPNPTGSFLMGYNSTTPVDEITPWIPEVSLEISIDIAGKRGYRIAQARHLSEAARLNIIATAWQVRSRLRKAFLDLFAAQENESLLARQQAIQADSLRILEAQLSAGDASPYEVTQSRIALAASRLAAWEAAKLHAKALIQLAAALGVPSPALAGVKFSFDELLQVRTDIPVDKARRQALFNRTDILAALAEYEASQSALQLEIAKQIPDINLGPGYQLDQIDNKWSLALSMVLPILSRNQGPIREAESRRNEVAARFLALQAKALGDIAAAIVVCQSAIDRVETAEAMLADIQKQEATAQARHTLGEISKLELLGVQMELTNAALARMDALVKEQQAVGELEDAMQSPLDVAQWLRETPARTSGNKGAQR